MPTNRDPYTQQGQKVNSKGQALNQVESRSEGRHVSEEGDLYTFSSGIIALTTTGSFNAVWLLQNTSESKDLHLGHFRTCGAVVCEWQCYEDITAGTLLSDATAASVRNNKIGSASSFVGNHYKGADAKTLTGTLRSSWINGIGHSQPDWRGSIIIPPQQMIALEVKPSTAGDICVTVEGWQVTPT